VTRVPSAKGSDEVSAVSTVNSSWIICTKSDLSTGKPVMAHKGKEITFMKKERTKNKIIRVSPTAKGAEAFSPL
jgi:hypothetical protein